MMISHDDDITCARTHDDITYAHDDITHDDITHDDITRTHTHDDITHAHA